MELKMKATMTTARARDYCAGDKFRCSCGFTMLIKSLEAHPERGERYERQTVACPKCGLTATREVFTPDATKKAKVRK